MIRLDGRVLPRLDEFMLRLGHLKVIANAACELQSTQYRVYKAAAQQLTAEVTVPEKDLPAVADYLKRKNLCPLEGTENSFTEGKDASQFRYPDLTIPSSKGARAVICRLDPSGQPRVWWQDLQLADARVPSKVGAVTVTAKGTSKTGLSHVFDWAVSLGLLSQTSQPSIAARLITKLMRETDGEKWLKNPYVLGVERVALAYIVLTSDMDIFSRLAAEIVGAPVPIRKSDAVRMFVRAVQRIAEEAEASRDLTSGSKFRIYEQLKELEKATSRKRPDISATSTAWHRAASRFETYVDLGFLEKGISKEEERYAYVYYPCKSFARIVETLAAQDTAEGWLNRHLVSNILKCDCQQDPVPIELLQECIPAILRAFASPAPHLPIEMISLAVAMLLAGNVRPVSLGSAREGLVRMAQERPDLARLARGYSGDRAEFVSFDKRRFAE